MNTNSLAPVLLSGVVAAVLIQLLQYFRELGSEARDRRERIVRSRAWVSHSLFEYAIALSNFLSHFETRLTTDGNLGRQVGKPELALPPSEIVYADLKLEDIDLLQKLKADIGSTDVLLADTAEFEDYQEAEKLTVPEYSRIALSALSLAQSIHPGTTKLVRSHSALNFVDYLERTAAKSNHKGTSHAR